jgi:predicted N-acetyltransferase YhbS
MSRPAPAWTIRQGTSDDSEALRDLFTVVFGRDRGQEHPAWKFDRNPAGPPVLALAEHEGRVVGQYALWPVRLRVGKEVLLGAQSLDTMTHPDYRGQGMFPRLAVEAMRFAEQRGVEVLFGFPNAASYPGFVNKLDWDHTGDVPQYARVLRPSGHPRIPGWAGPVTDALAAGLPSGPHSGFSTQSIAPDGEALVRLWAEGCQADECAVERDEAYVQWRFDPSSGMG